MPDHSPRPTVPLLAAPRRSCPFGTRAIPGAQPAAAGRPRPGRGRDGDPRFHAARRVAGFTLIELMVTVALIGLLAVLAGPNLMGMIRKAKLAGEARALYGDFVTAQGLAASSGHRHRLRIDRENKLWTIQEDIRDDESFGRLVKRHPVKESDEMPDFVELGPTGGITPAFPKPYDGLDNDSWCSGCSVSGQVADLVFDVDGRILDTAGEPAKGAVLLNDTTDGDKGVVEAVVFVGFTGDVRLFKMRN